MIYSECCFNTNNKKKACLLLTSKCNLNCIYCFSKCSNCDSAFGIDNIEDLILHLLENDIKYVVLSGGEPLLFNDIFKIIKALHVKGFEISMCTNATLATDIVCKRLIASGLKKVTISFDDLVKEKFDLITRKKDSFEKVIQGINNFVNNSFDVTINVVINDSNINRVFEIVNWAKRIGAKEICFTLPVCKSGNMFPIDEIVIKKLYSELEIISNNTDITIELNNPKCHSDNCPSNNSIWGIDTNGNIGDCLVKSFLKEDPVL